MCAPGTNHPSPRLCVEADSHAKQKCIHPFSQLAIAEHPRCTRDKGQTCLSLTFTERWRLGWATGGPWHLLGEDAELGFLGGSRMLAVGRCDLSRQLLSYLCWIVPSACCPRTLHWFRNFGCCGLELAQIGGLLIGGVLNGSGFFLLFLLCFIPVPFSLSLSPSLPATHIIFKITFTFLMTKSAHAL